MEFNRQIYYKYIVFMYTYLCYTVIYIFRKLYFCSKLRFRGNMNRLQALNVLRDWDKKGKYVFTIHELRKLFFQDNPKTFTEGIHRLVKDNILIRAIRGIYLNPHAASFDSYAIEHIAKAMHPGE
jgi:hypothetical protein